MPGISGCLRAAVAHGSRMFLDRYRLEYRVVMLIEKLLAGHKRRVMLRISPS